MRYSDNGVETLVPGVFGLVNGIDPGGSAAGFGGPSMADAWGLHANYLEIIRPTLLFEAKVGKLYFNTDSLPETFGQNIATWLRAEGINVDDRTSGLPNFTVAGYTTLGDPRFVPILLKNDTWQAQASLTNVRGAHNLRAGVAIVRRSMAPIQSNDGTGTLRLHRGPDQQRRRRRRRRGGRVPARLPVHRCRAPTWWSTPTLQHLGAERLRPGRLAGHRLADPECRPALRHLHAVHRGRRRDLEPRHQHAAVPHPGRERRRRHRRGGDRLRQPRAADRLCGHGPRDGTVVRGGYGLSFFPSSMASNAVLRNTPFTFTYAATSAAGSGAAPNVFFSTPLPTPVQGTPAVAGTIAAVDTDLKSSYLHQYNVMVEQQVLGGSVTAGYVGSKGRRMWMADARTSTTRRPEPAPSIRGATTRTPAPNLTTLRLLRSAGQQDYNAMQLAFARRSRGGLTVAANYTLAKGMSDVTQPGGGGAQQAYGVDPNRIHELEWSPSDIDIRHRYAFSLNYELPFGRDATGALRTLIADWQVNLLAYWQSGVPFTVFNTTARSNTGAGQDRPNQTCSGELDDPTIDQWFDTSCFVGQEINTIGNSGRNNLYGPPQRRADMSIFKDVVFGTQRLQLRLEVFNMTNTPSFAVPDGGLGSATFGRITSTGNNIPRQFQFAAKYLF